MKDITFEIPIADWIFLYTSFSAKRCNGHKIAQMILAHNQSISATIYEGCFWFLVKQNPWKQNQHELRQQIENVNPMLVTDIFMSNAGESQQMSANLNPN